MRKILPIILFFFCITAACITSPFQQVTGMNSTNRTNENSITIPIYSENMVKNIPFTEIKANTYADIPDNISPEFLPVIRNGSFSGNVSNISRIALQDPCILKKLQRGGFVLGVSYYIPFRGLPSPRFMVYIPEGTTDRRISALVDENNNRVDSLFIEYRYLTRNVTREFDPFTNEGWAGGYTCKRDYCPEVC